MPVHLYDIQVKGYVIHDGRILLMRRAAHDTSLGYWEAPGGGLDFGEEPVDAIRREVLEEAGLDFAQAAIVDARSWTSTDKVPATHGVDMIFAMQECRNDITGPILSEEHDQIGWFTAEQTDSLQMYPQVRQAIKAFLSRGGA